MAKNTIGIRYLANHKTVMKQLTHVEVNNKKASKEIMVIAENIRTPENVGMLLRISEAFGVHDVIIIGNSPNIENKKVLRTARNTEKVLNIQFFDTIDKVIPKLKKEKFNLIGLELTDKSKSISEQLFNQHKIALFVGAERFGLSDEILTQLDSIVHIDLFGKNSSINVVNALAIALYKITEVNV